MSFESITAALYDTGLSEAIRGATWTVPIIQSLHIVGITFLVGSALTMELRLAGVLATDERPNTVVARYLPWFWGALALLVVTGSLLVITEPYRELGNSTFWRKMITLAFALVLTVAFRMPIRKPNFELSKASWAGLVKPSAWIMLAAWVYVIICGRWIGYTW